MCSFSRIRFIPTRSAKVFKIDSLLMLVNSSVREFIHFWAFVFREATFTYNSSKAVLRHSTTSLKAADARELASSITVIANEKLKAEKQANGSKKKQGNESPEPC